MTFTYSLSTDRGKVRLLAADNNASNPIFTDDEIDAFLALEENSVRRAAALTLETMASEEARLQRALAVQADPPTPSQAAAEFRARAALLREQADLDEARDDDGLFDTAEMVHDDFSARERLRKQWLRENRA